MHSHRSTPPGSSLPCLPALSANARSFHPFILHIIGWRGAPRHPLTVCLSWLVCLFSLAVRTLTVSPQSPENIQTVVRFQIWHFRDDEKKQQWNKQMQRHRDHKEVKSNSLNPSKSCSWVGVSNTELSECAMSLQAVKHSKKYICRITATISFSYIFFLEIGSMKKRSGNLEVTLQEAKQLQHQSDFRHGHLNALASDAHQVILFWAATSPSIRGKKGLFLTESCSALTYSLKVKIQKDHL